MKLALITLATGTLFAARTTAAPLPKDAFSLIPPSPNGLCKLPRGEVPAFQAWFNGGASPTQPTATWIICKDKLENRKNINISRLLPPDNALPSRAFGRKGTVTQDQLAEHDVVDSLIKDVLAGLPKAGSSTDDPRCYSRDQTGQVMQAVCPQKDDSAAKLRVFKTKFVVPKNRPSVGEHQNATPMAVAQGTPRAQEMPAIEVPTRQIASGVPKSEPYAQDPQAIGYDQMGQIPTQTPPRTQYVPGVQMPAAEGAVGMPVTGAYAGDSRSLTSEQMAQMAPQAEQMPAVEMPTQEVVNIHPQPDTHAQDPQAVAYEQTYQTRPQAQYMPVEALTGEVPAQDPHALSYEKMAQIANRADALPAIEQRNPDLVGRAASYELDTGARPVPYDLLRHKNEAEETVARNDKVREMSTDDDMVAYGHKEKRGLGGLFDNFREPARDYIPTVDNGVYSHRQYETVAPYKEVTPENKKARVEADRRDTEKWKMMSNDEAMDLE
ncbi:hypothetical protein ACHAQH_004954 [Verticillium albo-atrum]